MLSVIIAGLDCGRPYDTLVALSTACRTLSRICAALCCQNTSIDLVNFSRSSSHVCRSRTQKTHFWISEIYTVFRKDSHFWCFGCFFLNTVYILGFRCFVGLMWYFCCRLSMALQLTLSTLTFSSVEFKSYISLPTFVAHLSTQCLK